MPRTTRAVAPRQKPRAAESPISSDKVAKVAYELFERRGCTHGQDQQDWFEAERFVRQQRRP